MNPQYIKCRNCEAFHKFTKSKFGECRIAHPEVNPSCLANHYKPGTQPSDDAYRIASVYPVVNVKDGCHEGLVRGGSDDDDDDD